MHDGFAGGAFLDARGRLLGMTTAAQIRGLGVVIPSRIVWKTASAVLAMGRPQRGYLGLAGQPVRLPEAQRGPDGREQALLIVSVTPGGPAETGGLLVGDILLELDGHAVVSPEELLDFLTGDRVGRAVAIRVRRGEAVVDLTVSVGERPAR
jgi:S1-C subfamily serine protease